MGPLHMGRLLHYRGEADSMEEQNGRSVCSEHAGLVEAIGTLKKGQERTDRKIDDFRDHFDQRFDSIRAEGRSQGNQKTTWIYTLIAILIALPGTLYAASNLLKLLVK
jgi:hypothetical protein